VASRQFLQFFVNERDHCVQSLLITETDLVAELRLSPCRLP